MMTRMTVAVTMLAATRSRTPDQRDAQAAAVKPHRDQCRGTRSARMQLPGAIRPPPWTSISGTDFLEAEHRGRVGRTEDRQRFHEGEDDQGH